MKISPRRNSEHVSNFIDKTYSILENGQSSSIVDWSASGASFLIKDVKKFEELVLPIYFKHSNFSSFVRQLNMYNFHKVRGDRVDCEFQHEKFKRGHQQLLPLIKRKQNQMMILSKNSLEESNGMIGQENDSNEQKKRQVKISSQNILDEMQIQDQAEELQNLKLQNKRLRSLKQEKLEKRKLFSEANQRNRGQKFFKLVTALMANKIQKELKIENSWKQEEMEYEYSFQQILGKVLDDSKADSFKNYSLTVLEIANKQTNYNFMMNSLEQ